MQDWETIKVACTGSPWPKHRCSVDSGGIRREQAPVTRDNSIYILLTISGSLLLKGFIMVYAVVDSHVENEPTNAQSTLTL